MKFLSVATLIFCLIPWKVSAAEYCWPANGCITSNKYTKPIQVCFGGKIESKDPGWTSKCRPTGANPCEVEDVDHIKEPKSGKWLKLKNDNASVLEDGTVSTIILACDAKGPCGECK